MKKLGFYFITVLAVVTLVVPSLYANEVELHWLTWGNIELDGHLEIARMFEERNPGIKINVEQVPFDRYEDKVRTVIAGGSSPDIIQVNDSYTLSYAQRGLLQSLNDFMENSDLDPAWQEPFADHTFDGQRMGFGMGIGVRLMFYNVDLFDEAGLDYPPAEWGSEDWTWDDMVEAAKALTDPSKNQWGVIAIDNGWEQSMTANINGVGVFSSSSDLENQQWLMGREPGIEGIQMLADLTHVHGVQPPWGMISHMDIVGYFMTGKLGMVAGMSNNLANVREGVSDFEWDVAPMPVINHGYNEASARLYGIPVGAKNPELAWKFMEFWMSQEAQRVIARTGYGIPVRMDVAEGDFIKPDLPPKNQQLFLEGIAFNRGQELTPATEYARQVWRPQLPRVWSGELTAREALMPLVDEIEEALHKAWTGEDY